MVSSWEAAHSLVEDSISEADIAAAPCLPALAVASLSASGWGGAGPQLASSTLVFDQSFVL